MNLFCNFCVFMGAVSKSMGANRSDIDWIRHLPYTLANRGDEYRSIRKTHIHICQNWMWIWIRYGRNEYGYKAPKQISSSPHLS